MTSTRGSLLQPTFGYDLGSLASAAGHDIAVRAGFDAEVVRSERSAAQMKSRVRAGTFSMTATLIVADAALLLYDLAKLLQGIAA